MKAYRYSVLVLTLLFSLAFLVHNHGVLAAGGLR